MLDGIAVVENYKLAKGVCIQVIGMDFSLIIRGFAVIYYLGINIIC